ncbi:MULTISPECIES: hypothetical protein [Sphingobacterium]|uniref:Uncharacterized protein n=1 Tax=Sphingobacterium kitahiroshimense TaxID=470446 RepID=A0ABV0BNB8_9SPHI|nr:hypothetical protein [Sphingobacterium sp. JUb56]MBB2949298.1 hypothetical protein [Sphingobacterium sp. JUb56]
MDTEDQKKKESYIPPILSITIVEMEQGVAAGSAQVSQGVSPLEDDYLKLED